MNYFPSPNSKLIILVFYWFISKPILDTAAVRFFVISLVHLPFLILLSRASRLSWLSLIILSNTGLNSVDTRRIISSMSSRNLEWLELFFQPILTRFTIFVGIENSFLVCISISLWTNLKIQENYCCWHIIFIAWFYYLFHCDNRLVVPYFLLNPAWYFQILSNWF